MFKRLLEDIEKGINGEVAWIPLQYPRLGSQVGIAKRMYHLVGGDPGTGKTAFVDQTYVLDAYDWASRQDDVKYEVVYFSMERSKKYKMAKFLCQRLYTEHNILIDVPSILGWGTAKIEITDFIMECIKGQEEYFDKMMESVDILDGADNPTGIYMALKQRALENGTIYKRDKDGQYFKETLASWKNNSKIKIEASNCPMELKKGDKEYVPNDDKVITQVILDHIGKMKTERGYNDKQILDKTSEYLGEARDLYGYSVTPISQFNRNNADIQRRIKTDLTPEQQDFKGSGNMYEDADVVLGLFNPDKHGIKDHAGYTVSMTKNNYGVSRFRSITLLKNSYGMDNATIGFNFLGENGFFRELPSATKMTQAQYEEMTNV